MNIGPVRSPFTIAAMLLGMLLVSRAAVAQDNFYAGKTIRVIVATAPGGGADAYGRLLARHLGQHIPGNPNVIAENLVGADGVVAIQSLNINLPKDGTAIVTFNPGLLLTSVTSPNAVKVKFTDFAWLGSIAAQQAVCYTWGGAGIKNWDDLVKKSLIYMGDSGVGSGAYVQQMVLQQMFGIKINEVSGYKGGSEKLLAIERGEIQGDCAPWTTIPTDWLRDNKIDLIVRFSKTAPVGLPASVPYIGDLVNDPAKKQLLDVLDAPNALGRPFILSASVAADRIKILRDAFDQVMTDPDFVAEAQKQSLPVSPISGVAAADTVKEMNSLSPDILASAKAIVGQ